MKKNIRKIFTCAAVTALLMLIFVTEAFAAQEFLLGDIDASGEINSADARQALRYAVTLDVPNRINVSVGDVDRDGKISAADARLILRVSVGLDSFNGETVSVDTDSAGSGDLPFIDPSQEGDEYENLIGGSDLFDRVVPPAPAVNAASGTFTFTVYGYGHGVGLSQYGAVALAESGWQYTDILAYYYTGTSVVFNDSYPQTSLYPSSSGDKQSVNTEELIARIVAMEIGGITQNPNALKAQAVAVYTLLKRCDFNVRYKYDVGYAVSSYDSCSAVTKQAVHEIMGQYVAVTNDYSKAPAETVYSAMAAGRSAGSKDVWGGSISYLSSVDSPFEMRLSNFISTVTFSADELRQRINKYNSAISLSGDPSEWLEIVSHTASVDSSRGYVTQIRVGDAILSGYNQFFCGVLGSSLRSSCFTVTYTP